MDMGHLEVEDQVDGVQWLVEQGLSDPQRVGVYGWSYGGYMAAMCLARARRDIPSRSSRRTGELL